LLRGALMVVLEAECSSIADLSIGGLHCKWCETVNIYSCRALTLGTDCLPAISGIFARFGSILCDEYKAGLWKSTMECELLWRIVPECEPALLRPRPREYQAPPWSWADLNVPVIIQAREHWSVHSCHDFEILDCKINFEVAHLDFSAYDASFGSVKSRSLKVRGRLGPAEWTHDGVLRRRNVQGRNGNLPATLYPDALEPEFSKEDPSSILVFLLKITSRDDNGLMLRQQSDSTFSRLGVFSFNKSGIPLS
jgi:hypothetical protein